MKRAISLYAATEPLALARHIFAEEMRAARRHNPGSKSHELFRVASAAAFKRLVSELERVCGVKGTLDVPEARRAREDDAQPPRRSRRGA